MSLKKKLYQFAIQHRPDNHWQITSYFYKDEDHLRISQALKEDAKIIRLDHTMIEVDE